MEYKSFFSYLWEGRPDRFWSAYWLDSRGMFHEVYIDESKKDGHFNFAKKYCQEHDINCEAYGPIDELFKRGWIRVTYNYHLDKALNFDYGPRLPSDAQLKSLRNKAAELGAISIFDDKRDKEVEY